LDSPYNKEGTMGPGVGTHDQSCRVSARRGIKLRLRNSTTKVLESTLWLQEPQGLTEATTAERGGVGGYSRKKQVRGGGKMWEGGRGVGQKATFDAVRRFIMHEK